MERKGNFEYNEEVDSLVIYHEKAKDEPVMGSLTFGNFIFDIGTGGTFISLEIDNASEIFNSTPKNLENIKSAKIKTLKQGDAVLLIYDVELDNKEYERTLMIPRNKIHLTA